MHSLVVRRNTKKSSVFCDHVEKLLLWRSLENFIVSQEEEKATLLQVRKLKGKTRRKKSRGKTIESLGSTSQAFSIMRSLVSNGD